ncbi:hypothetical protein COB52_05985, partial [Candidatus Kaiserbacteria bacterium]
MIARKIPKKSNVPDNYKRLAQYIAAAEEPGEKLDRFWIVNCNAGETINDLDTALIEIGAVRRLKPNVADKTYHMIVSFRPGEKERLSDEDLKDIEATYAKALGYEEHQRVVGTHINTDNFHMHIAFNKVHPETLKVHSPVRDFRALDKASRQLEQKYGLYVDNGMSKTPGSQPKLSSQARTFESHTWQESFQNHVLQHRSEILERVKDVQNWQELHAVLAEYDIQLKKRGNGFALSSPDGQHMKASALDRQMGQKHLEDRLGEFQPQAGPSPQETSVRPKRAYRPRPLLRHPGGAGLWRRYLGTRQPQLAKSGLLNRTISNWKLFLISEAYRDPLAIVFIMAHTELLTAVFGDVQSTRALGFPKVASDALRVWREAGKWADAQSLDWLADTRSVGRGCRIDDAGNLVVPFKNAAGHMQAVRLYSPDGKATNIGDMKTGVLTHVIDTKKALGPGPVIFTSDYADAVKIHDATRRPVVVVSDAAKMTAAIDQFQRQHKELKAIVSISEWQSAKIVPDMQLSVSMPALNVEMPQGITFDVHLWKGVQTFNTLSEAIPAFESEYDATLNAKLGDKSRELIGGSWIKDGSQFERDYANSIIERYVSRNGSD